MTTQKRLLAIIEMGGYTGLLPLFERHGYRVDVEHSQRKARNYLKKTVPELILAEYHYQRDFRDRSSNLETLMSVLQRHPQTRLIALYLPENEERMRQFREQFPLFAALPFPVTAEQIETLLKQLEQEYATVT